MDMRLAGGGGGCTSRYGIVGGCGGGCGCGLYDISMVDRVMLKFRPIAPKPLCSGSCSDESMTVNNGGKSGGGNKRRYVRVVKGSKKKKNNEKRKVLTSSKIVSGDGDAVVTLSLMPETPDRKNSAVKYIPLTTRLGFKNNCQQSLGGHMTMPQSTEMHPTVWLLTVERVTETTVEGGAVDWTEMERDTCPRFISDGGDKVVWKNKAFREMAGGGEEQVVLLVRKEGRWPAAFTCHVRVTCRSGMRFSALTLPCDTWILEGGSGGYAWRLDVKAALSLGR